jgi:hypothetical protein
VGTVCYASDYCHWDCHFPDSVRDIVDARDLNFEQKKRILGLNAIDFFELENLPEPGALKIAQQTWHEGDTEKARAQRYEARENV